ncbi:MAG TPA: AI-2E family transporter [Methylomirabilota bacterium]|nr:AI-2E family transporter [Methylomirabilota bacterium]
MDRRPGARHRKEPDVGREADTPRALIAWTIAVVTATALGLWLLWTVRPVVMLLYTSALLAIGIAPAVHLVERRGRFGRPLPRSVALLVVYAVGLAAVAGVGIAVLPAFVRQARGFAQRLPDMIDQVQAWLVQRGVLEQPLTVGEALRRVPGGADAVQVVLGAVWGVVGGVVGLITVLILTFYIVLDAERLRASLVRLLPASHRAHGARAATEIARKVSAWLGGQLLLSAVIGTSTAIALALMGVPYFFVLALISAVGELIPVVGPILGAIPALAVAFSISTHLAIFVGIFFVVQQQTENHVLVPRLMAHQVGVSPIAVIVALLVGSTLLGLPGAILAVPTAAIVQVLVQETAGRE